MINRRGPRGGKRLDVQSMRSMIGQQQMTSALGVVRKFPGQDSHFEIVTENGSNEIMVDVELMPSGTRVLCRLGFGNDGVYRIPREGTEVAVLVPYDSSSLIKDSLDYEAIIVGVLNVNAPSALTSDDTIVLEGTKVRVLTDNVEVGSSATPATSVTIFSDNVTIGSTPPAPFDHVVVGSGIDSFTGATYFALGSTSSTTKVKK